MSEFLLELYTEEIPANQLDAGSNKALNILQNELVKASLLKEGCEINMNYTPNRLVFYSNDISDNIAPKRGPKVNANEKGIQAFMRKYNVDCKENLKIINDYYYYEPQNTEQEIIETLGKSINYIFNRATKIWLKTMKWTATSDAWIRPVRNILSLYNNKIIPCNFNQVKGGDTTLPSKKYVMEHDFQYTLKTINSYNEYKQYMQEQGIIIDNNSAEQRAFYIKALCKAEGMDADEALYNNKIITENANLVERPFVIQGEINIAELCCNIENDNNLTPQEIFENIPQEALSKTMIKDQKYIPVYNNEKDIKNYYLSNKFYIVEERTTLSQTDANEQELCNAYFNALRNIDQVEESKQQEFNNAKSLLETTRKAYQDATKDYHDSVKAGHAKVISARLKDILHFYQEDIKEYKDINIEKVKLSLQQKIDSKSDKTWVSFSEDMHETYISLFGDKDKIKKELFYFLKLDLSSNLVREMASVQGTAGSQYAKTLWKNILTNEVALSEKQLDSFSKALHMMYEYNNIISLSDLARKLLITHHMQYIKLHFNMGHQPTSSGDPYGIKRIGNAVAKLLYMCYSDEFLKAFKEIEKIFGTEIYNFIIKRISYINKTT